MEDKKRSQYKEYIGLNGDRKELGKSIEGAIIPLMGGLLDYMEIMLDTLSIDDTEAQRAFSAIRKKILRNGNDCVRSLLSDLHSYSIKRMSKEIIKFDKQ